MKSFIKQNWPWILLILYFIIPIDIIPDMLAPIIGPIAYADDISLVIIFIVSKFLLPYFMKPKANTRPPSKSPKIDSSNIIEGEIVEDKTTKT